MKPIYADINKYDAETRLILTCYGSQKDLDEQGIVLYQGLELLFYSDDQDETGQDDELIFKGVVEHDDENDRWTARINWDEIKNRSQLTTEEILLPGLQTN